jgi:ABC-type Na+ efflux pump permease subunit
MSPRHVWFVTWTDFRSFLREKETVLWVFVMPIVFFTFFGFTTSGFGPSEDGQSRIAVRGGDEGGLVGGRIVSRLEGLGYAVTHVDSAHSGTQITLPPALTDSVLAGRTATVIVDGDEGDLAAQADLVQITRAVYTTLADLAAVSAVGDTLSAAALVRLDGIERSLTVRVEPAGRRRVVPSGFDQAVPGTMVMFILLNMLTGGAILLMQERSSGLLRRLATAPISRAEIVAGKLGARLGLGVLQVAMGILAGTFIFGVDWGPDLPMVVLVLLAWAALAAAIGILVGSVVRSEGQAVGLGVTGSMVLAALGGCWWPIEITPDALQAVQKFLPTGWAMDALHRLCSFQLGAASALPHLLAILAAGAIVTFLAARGFRFE